MAQANLAGPDGCNDARSGAVRAPRTLRQPVGAGATMPGDGAAMREFSQAAA
jgi:hypothetical protein